MVTNTAQVVPHHTRIQCVSNKRRRIKLNHSQVLFHIKKEQKNDKDTRRESDGVHLWKKLKLDQKHNVTKPLLNFEVRNFSLSSSPWLAHQSPKPGT